jgi:hypothetical protein
MTTVTPRRLTFFCSLAAIMAATRSGHLGTPWSLPDASWAVFYIAGFHFRREWRWGLPALLGTAMAVDFAVIRYFGVSSYCVTAAYAFNIPAYSLLWAGGSWLRNRYRHEALDGVRCAASLALVASLCFLLTNATFYWLGGRVAQPTLAGWSANAAQWYPGFLGVTFVYVGIAALLQLALARSARPLPTAAP